MKKRVLLLMPNNFNIRNIVESIILSIFPNVELISLDLPQSFKYNHFHERFLHNFVFKPFLKRSYKDYMKNNVLIEDIKKLENIDLILSIRADMYEERVFKLLNTFNCPMILHLWDSISKEPNQLKYFKYFDQISSFEIDDCKKYNLKYRPNFFIQEKIDKYFASNIPLIYDSFVIMTYDSRYTILEELANKIIALGKKILYICIGSNYTSLDKIKHFKDAVPLNESYKYMTESKTLLEIGHAHSSFVQKGLSLRSIEALGLKKKLITTSTEIKEYDFYNPKNILVIDPKNIEIPLDFFDTPYEDVPFEIYNKYSSDTWIKDILGDYL